jgi:pimeloyl-ACP methyl ester carboxylesterase
MAAPITERFVEIDRIRIRLRERAGEGVPAVFVHGNPTQSGDWIPFLEAIDGPAIAPDLPGFGRSDRPPPGVFDASIGAYARFCRRLLDELAPDGCKLVAHDWGSVALVAAQRDPGAIDRLVAINAVPLHAGYRWHWIARLWRRRGLGELFNATATRAATARLLRLARAGRRPMPPELVDMVWDNFSSGSGPAILALYRSADPDVLGAAGERLRDLSCPALVVWGAEDPYLSIAEARWYADTLPEARLELVPGAGHWPWVDQPSVVGMVTDFLAN